jgi:hypothetical protein
MTKVAGLHGAMADKIYVKQLSGFSLVDKKEKNKSNSTDVPDVYTN